MSGDDDLAALSHQRLLASSAAVSASDHDLAYQLQLGEAVQASLPAHNNPHSSSSSSQAAAPAFPESSDASYALAVHAADLSRAEEDHRYAQAFHAQAAASLLAAAHDALFARDLAAIPEDRWAHDGDYFERPMDSHPHFSVFFKGMARKVVVGPRDRGPGVAVLAVAVCGPQGDVVLPILKPVEGSVGGREVLEGMALLEGLNAALESGIQSVRVVTDYKALHNHVLGIWHTAKKKVVDMINQVQSMQKKFKQFEISLVPRSQVSYVMKLARDSIDAQIAKSLSVNAIKEGEETCTICLEDTDISKIHAVEGCAHRFCFSCMSEHVKVKLYYGMLPACPQDGCTTKLSVEGSKIFLSPFLLEIMVQRIREEQIPPTQRIYCPYPKCSALMSLSEVIYPMQDSSSKYTVADAATLRKCVKCGCLFCINCKVPWHDGMTCEEYKGKYPHGRPEDAKLQNLAWHELWRQCVKCSHMIELAEGCYHITCLCGYEFCYTCGKEWKDKKATCSCPLWDEHNIIRDDIEDNGDDDSDDEDYDYYDENSDDDVYGAGEWGAGPYNQVY